MAPMVPSSIEDYISAAPAEVRPILERLRTIVRKAAPEAEERISYRMPAFFQGGVLVYFAAFKEHIGLYPPVTGDAALEAAVAPYAGEKGNLRFPLDKPIPFKLVERIVKHRLRQNLAKLAARGRKR